MQTEVNTNKKKTKFIFVTGGVLSGLGKGIAAASLGRLLKQRGLKVAAQKLDPYMNVDPSKMSPFQHGEVFVTDDGAETDLDLGHYERFIDENLTEFSSLTSGKVYWEVLKKERAGGFNGGTVQIIPDVTNAVKDFIYQKAATSGADVLISEIGGTVGDIESQPYLETARQIYLKEGADNCIFIHLTWVPYLKCSGEHKSKPSQHSVKELRSLGISPNIIITRADEPLQEGIKEKISKFCNVDEDCVIENETVGTLYEVPLRLYEGGLCKVVCRELKIEAPEPNLTEWRGLVAKIAAHKTKTKIAIVGKYIKLHDAYLSIVESLKHAGFELGVCVDIEWVDSEALNDKIAAKIFKGINGIIVPGGFGGRGFDGKIATAKYARENDIPYLGISFGLQAAVIDFAKNVAGLKDADSIEIDENTSCAVIDYMESEKANGKTDSTLRLGAYPCAVAKGTKLHKAYNKDEISERHRHRFEFNNIYRKVLSEKGMVFSGISPDDTLVEAIELSDKKFFVGVQFHPEFKSRPNRPHPLFLELLRATSKSK
ncbi:MAG: CTP synthase [Firmicutes bacterium]|nr:CTP synthase [Bacillota bacterium]